MQPAKTVEISELQTVTSNLDKHENCLVAEVAAYRKFIWTKTFSYCCEEGILCLFLFVFIVNIHSLLKYLYKELITHDFFSLEIEAYLALG